MGEEAAFSEADEMDALVHKAKADDPAALARLCEIVTPRLFVGISLRLARSAPANVEPEDILQETWARALPRLAQFTGGGSFVAWLFGFSKNILFEVARRSRIDRRVTIAADAGGPYEISPSAIPASVTSISHKVARDESIRKIARDMSTFDRTDQELLVLMGVEEMSSQAAAERLGLPQAMIAKRWYRLREQLAALHRDEPA